MKQIAFILLIFLLAQSINAQTYNLLGPEKPFTGMSNGTTIHSEKGAIKMKVVALDVEMAGDLNLLKGEFNNVVTIISENEVTIKFENYSMAMEMTLDGETSKEKEKMPISGKTAAYVKVKEKWSLKNPKKFSSKQIEELNYFARIIPLYFHSLEGLFPTSVKIGDEWEVKDADLTPIIGSGEDVKGIAKLTLVSVDEVEDDIVATIGIVTKYTAIENEATSEMELIGTIKRSIKDYEYFSVETTGKFKMFSDVIESGMKVNVIMEGDCISTQSRFYK